MLKNSTTRYGSVAQFLHWLIVIAFVGLFIVADVMGDLPKDGSAFGIGKFELYGLHKSVGFTLLGLVILRVIWRLMNTAPELPAGMPQWQIMSAKLLHLALYAVMFIMPISGYIMSQAGGHGLSWFGVWQVPNVIGLDKGLAGIAHELHEIVPVLIYILVAIHVAAAFYHHFVLKDNVFTRMLPYTK